MSLDDREDRRSLSGLRYGRGLCGAEARRKLREAGGALRAAFAFAGLADDAEESAPTDASIPLGRYWPVVFAAMGAAARNKSTRLAESVAMLVSARRKHTRARSRYKGLLAYVDRVDGDGRRTP